MIQIGLLYLAVAIVLAIIGIKDEPRLNRHELVSLATAALLWVLFYIPWRGYVTGKHVRAKEIL